MIKEDGHMITARQEPRLVLVSITYEDDRLTFKAPGMDQLVLQSKLPSSNRIHNCRYPTWGLGDPGTRGPGDPRRARFPSGSSLHSAVCTVVGVVRSVKEVFPRSPVWVGIRPVFSCE